MQEWNMYDFLKKYSQSRKKEGSEYVDKYIKPF